MNSGLNHMDLSNSIYPDRLFAQKEEEKATFLQ